LRPVPASPVLVFSPHLDDAVLSLGNLIAAHPGSIVVTVLAGMPPDETMTTEWDATCGFENAGESMRARWAEDDAALSTLSARSVHLDFLDRQYGKADRHSVAAEIERIIAEHPDHDVYGPLGLIHPDHILVSSAFLDAVSSLGATECALYADIPYYAIAGSLDRRRAELEQWGVAIDELVPVTEEIVTAAAGAGLQPAKVRARELYASQMRALGNVPLDLAELTAAVRCTSRR
jgi:LmbE family N-acetylglucosaminyl deacetylase